MNDSKSITSDMLRNINLKTINLTRKRLLSLTTDDLINNIKIHVDMLIKEKQVKKLGNLAKPSEIAEIVRCAIPMRISTNSISRNQCIPYYYNADEHIWTDDSSNYLAYLLEQVLNLTTCDDIITLTRKVVNSLNLTHRSRIPKIQNAPKTLIQFKNGVYDVMAKTFTDNDSSDISKFDKYHFTKLVPFNCIMDKSKIDKDMYDYVNGILNDWSNKDKQFKNILLEISMSVMMGYNRKVAIVIKSKGGDGKSTFIEINKHLCSVGSAVAINMYQLGTDNYVNQINSNTQLIYGDDASKAGLTDKATVRMKSLTTGNAFQAEVKYFANTVVQSTAVIIQATNEDIAIYENNTAIADRLIILDWSHHNFRRENKSKGYEESLKLDTMIGLFADVEPNEKFYETYIHIVLTKVADYNGSYTTWDALTNRAAEMLDNSDVVAQYVKWLNDNQLLSCRYIPLNTYYDLFKLYVKRFNNGMKLEMSVQTFSRRFTALVEQFNFVKPTKDVKKSLKNLSHLESCKLELMKNYNISETSERERCLVNDNYEIKDNELTDFHDHIKQLDYDIPQSYFDDDRKLAMMRSIAYDKLDSMMQSIYESEYL